MREKSLTMSFIFMYNRSIYKVTIYLLFAMMSVAESKNIYQWRNVYQCVYFRVLFVLFLVEMIAQLTCLLGLGYLPVAQATLVLKITWVFSFIINVVCAIVGIIIAIAGNGSFLGTPLPLMIATDSGLALAILGMSIRFMVFSLPNPLISSLSNPLAVAVILTDSAAVFTYIIFFSVFLYAIYLQKKGDDSPRILLASSITCAFGPTFTGASCLIFLFAFLYQETLTHEQLYGNIPFLIVPLVYYALKALGTGSLWIFSMFARSNNGEEESKKLLGDASMSTFRTF
jgi:hypothetical protein